MEDRVHPDEEQGGGETQADGEPGARLDDRGEDPHAEVGQYDAGDLPEAAAAVDLEIGGEVLLPAPAAGNVCGVHSEVLGVEPVQERVRPALRFGSRRWKARSRACYGRCESAGCLAHQD